MESARNRQLAEAVLATLASGALYYFGNGMNPVWPLVWFAPLPVLWLALRVGPATAALAAAGAVLLGGLNIWNYLTVSLGAPVIAWVVTFVAAAVVFAAGLLIFRALVRAGAVWTGLLSMPAIWVAAEYGRSVVSPHGTVGSLAYSQLDFLAFLQLASLTGPWGMSYLLVLFPCALAIGLHLRTTAPRLALQVVGVSVATVASALVFGAVRLATPQAAPVVKVGLIASDRNAGSPVADPGPQTDRLIRDYTVHAEQLAAAGAKVIVLPEKLGVTVQGQSDATLQSVADRTGATLVAGVVHVDGPVKYNSARIFAPGTPGQRYDKQHMLPPFESHLKPGDSLTLLPHPHQTWGVAICKDMDFASPARSYADAGAGLLLVPAWDFTVDAFSHGHVAIMRGVEGGFSVARAARNGFLTVSDSRGRILGEVSSSSAPFATLLVDVPAAHTPTVYQSLSDWFPWAAAALLLFSLLSLRGRLRQR